MLAGGAARRGVRVDIAYGGRGLKGAMKAADRSGARYTLVLGERDLAEGTVEVKDMAPVSSGRCRSPTWSTSWRAAGVSGAGPKVDGGADRPDPGRRSARRRRVRGGRSS